MYYILAWSKITDAISNAADGLGSKIMDAFNNWFFGLIYTVDKLILLVMNAIYQVLGVFIGMQTVTYNKHSNYLINIFFEDSVIKTVYWGMALIGIALSFGFAIFSVIRKIFDNSEKVKQTLGMIIQNLLKSTFVILLMNAIIIAVLTATNVFFQQITYLFDNAPAIAQNKTIEFDDNDIQIMARILDKIGNYSLNPSRDSRYNINSCFNEIRPDMLSLQNRNGIGGGAFDYSYEDYVLEGDKVIYRENTNKSWQYVLTQIAKAHDLYTDQPIDEYSQELTSAITSAMNTMNKQSTFVPIKTYHMPYVKIKSTNIQMDVIVFLAATMDSARNSYFNHESNLYDSLRVDYINGVKDIYSWDTVRNDFSMYNLGVHVLIILIGLLLGYNFLKIAFNCIARIFNMVLLYIIFPPIAATMPLDDGGKVKQWTVAFMVQSLSVFATLIAVRILMFIIPIIFNSELILLDNSFLNFLAKMVFLIGLVYTVEKAGGIITGILTDQAGWQSLTAGNIGDDAAKETIKKTAKGVSKITQLGGKTVSGTGKGVFNFFGRKSNNSEKGSDSAENIKSANKGTLRETAGKVWNGVNNIAQTWTGGPNGQPPQQAAQPPQRPAGRNQQE